MEVHIVTLFPDLFASPLKESILGKAIDRGVVDVAVHDLRDHAQDKHRTADDAPYGGGAGMVLKPEPIIRALRAIEAEAGPATVVLLTPPGNSLLPGAGPAIEQGGAHRFAVRPLRRGGRAGPALFY